MNKTTHRFTQGLHLLVTVALLAGLALGLRPVPVAHAATFNIADGDVTALINAINTANGNAEADTINLAAGGTYTLTAVDNDTDGPNGLSSIADDGAGNGITINGNGATIQRSSAGGTPDFRILHVAPGGDLTLNDVTITNGDPGANSGGGIYNEGTLKLENVTVKDNDAGGDGGGICNYYDGTLTANNSIVSGNTAGWEGGGIHEDWGDVTLTNCTVSGNKAPSDDGGGISNSGGTLTLENCTVSGNTAGYGGGIYNEDTLALENSTVSDNEADEGGGIFNDRDADLTLTNCTVSGNKATATGSSYGNGGGILNEETADLTLTNCTVSGNKANDFGGGIHQTCFTADTLVLLADGSFKRIADVQVGDAPLGYDFVANVPVTNVVQHTLQSEADSYLQINGLEVTESHPFAVGPDQWVEAGQLRVGDWVVGDGLTEITHVGRVYESISVYNLTVADTHNYYVSDGSDLFLVHNKPDGNGGQVDLNNVTITNNTADDDNDNDGDGGGIHQDGAATPNFRNTIIAGNIDKSTPTLDDCDGSLSSQGYNLVGNGTGCPSGGTGDQTTTDPKLGPLQDNGGPTETHALLSGSPAIDAATDCTTVAGDAVTQDQRGEPRPADGDQDGTAICDIGAYEAPPPEPVGGVVVPVSRLGLLAPWLGLAALASLAALTVALGRRRRG
jgi:hypothetical protein